MKGRYIGESVFDGCMYGKVYEIFGESLGLYQVKDDSGELYLYSIEDFELVEEDGEQEKTE